MSKSENCASVVDIYKNHILSFIPDIEYRDMLFVAKLCYRIYWNKEKNRIENFRVCRGRKMADAYKEVKERHPGRSYDKSFFNQETGNEYWVGFSYEVGVSYD